MTTEADALASDVTEPAPETEPDGRSLKKRLLLVGVAALALAAIGIGYTVWAGARPSDSAYASGDAAPVSDPGLYLHDQGGYVVLQDGGGKVSVDDGSKTPPRTGTGVDCLRFYAAGENAVCVRPQGGLKPMTTVEILDTELAVKETFKFEGVPSRARVSPSGKMIAWTLFVTGDSYAGTNFSTRTGLYDVDSNYLVDSIEEIQLYIDGKRVRRPDVNYWGITFAADDNTFYATVATDGKTYLVKGDYENWTATTVRENVECPSLSPDETRLVFKKRVNEGVEDPWRLYVLDLETMQEKPLAEDRNVDDQAAWLDDDTVAYMIDGDVWSVPADGSGEPKLIAPDATSPVMVGG
ncbi:hypothetical protein LTA6_002133 [Microbacterium sp. LTA6]|uniref:hypothetical protein n=1 Tax=Microbacterium sp. LTA6 TaxID=3129771 RepID=UPI00324C57BC